MASYVSTPAENMGYGNSVAEVELMTFSEAPGAEQAKIIYPASSDRPS